jgi:hypothetical protein
VSIFEDHRADPHVPGTWTPNAAQDGGPDGEGGAGASVDFFVTLSASLGTLADEMRADRERRASFRPPSDEQIFASGTFPSSGNLILDLGSVPLGRVWQVRRIIVGGATVTTTAAGNAFVFAQGAPPTDLNLTNCVDIFLGSLQALPQGDTFGTHQLFLRNLEHLWVVFTGGTSGQQYTASARVEDWEDSSFQSTFAE